jgi:hypothetical protein
VERVADNDDLTLVAGAAEERAATLGSDSNNLASNAMVGSKSSKREVGVEVYVAEFHGRRRFDVPRTETNRDGARLPPKPVE